jgi:hypothetical protein
MEGDEGCGYEWVIYWALFEQAQIGTQAVAAAAVTCTKSYELCTRISWILQELWNVAQSAYNA